MHKLTKGEGPRTSRVRALELAAYLGAGLIAFEVATHYPSRTKPLTANVSWREKDWSFWYNAQQLYRRDPEELTESQFENVKRWCRCAQLVRQYWSEGLSSLTDDECGFVAETLPEFCPNLQEHINFSPPYDACRRRLAAQSHAAAPGKSIPSPK